MKVAIFVEAATPQLSWKIALMTVPDNDFRHNLGGKESVAAYDMGKERARNTPSLAHRVHALFKIIISHEWNQYFSVPDRFCVLASRMSRHRMMCFPVLGSGRAGILTTLSVERH
jgi:hypothetical protein